MGINFPYPVYGKVYDTDGTTLMGSGVTVKLRNETTGELLSASTNSNSEYGLDGGNFASGYSLTDKFTVYTYSENLYKDVTLVVSEGKHQFNLTLETVTDSSLIYYCTVQDVWDELDEVSATDISARRVIKAIQRAEKEIEEKAQISFRSVTYTNEVYDYNQITTTHSPENLYLYGNNLSRTDYMNLNYKDRLYISNRPIISVTSLERNTSGETGTDTWESLTEQSGSGGDFVISDTGKRVGYIDFVGNKPRYGKRAVRLTYLAGYAVTPKNIERLAILLSIRDILLSKMSRSFFDSPHGVSLSGIMVDRSTAHVAYMKMLNEEIDRLFTTIGSEFIAV